MKAICKSIFLIKYKKKLANKFNNHNFANIEFQKYVTVCTFRFEMVILKMWLEMSKHKFTAEFELRASPKVLFPYFSSASGLQQWFAEKVVLKDSTTFDFLWDGESHVAKLSQLRLQKSAKFDFLPANPEEKDHNYLEFKLDVSDLTGSTYLKVIDYSSNFDDDELTELWEDLIFKLKEIVGN
jgi:START-like superfamily domain